LAEDLALLARDDNGSQLMRGPVRDRGVAGAMLADLAAAHRLGYAAPNPWAPKGLVVVTDRTPTGHEPLDKVLEWISASGPELGRERSPREWVRTLASRRRFGEVELLLGLDKGLPDHSHNPALRAQILTRLGEVFTSGTQPDPRTAALAALVAACGASAKLFPDVDRRVRKRRLAEVSTGQWAADGVRHSSSAVAAATAAADAVTSTVAHWLEGI